MITVAGQHRLDDRRGGPERVGRAGHGSLVGEQRPMGNLRRP